MMELSGYPVWLISKLLDDLKAYFARLQSVCEAFLYGGNQKLSGDVAAAQ